MTALLEIDNLNFSYDNHAVLRSVKLQLDAPGIIGLLGLNGEGKSTLLKLIAGALPAGKAIHISPQLESNWHPVGYLPERPLFYGELTVRENLEFTAKLYGIEKHHLSSYLDEALKITGLSPKQKQLAGSLSKGYQQRLGLAMASIHKPELLLLDEPTDGLDPQQVSETHALIKRLSLDCAVIISSHRLDEIKKLCDRILILHDGQLASDIQLAETDDTEALDSLFKQITRAETS